MNTRITKQMASDAAKAIADDLYRKQITEAKAAVYEAASDIVLKYIPTPVLAMAKEYPDYVGATTSVHLKSYDKDGYLLYSIHAILPYSLPQACNYINVCQADYFPLLKLYDVYNGLVKSRDKEQIRFRDALLELRTIKAVKRSMPEALTYLDVPAEINLPVRVYDDLRQILQTINTKDNETDSNS